MKNILGKVIRDRRKSLKLKVYELADKVGVQPEFITQIEKGNRLPSEKVLAKIAKILGFDIKPYYYVEKHPDIIPYLSIEALENIKTVDLADGDILFSKLGKKGFIPTILPNSPKSK